MQDSGYSMSSDNWKGQSRVQAVTNVLFLDLGVSYKCVFNLWKFARPYV